MSVWDAAVFTIFVREFLEGTIIIGQFRTIVNNTDASAETKKQYFRAIWVAAGVALAFAILVVAGVAIPLIVLSSTFDDTTAEIIEGSSKIVAAFCVLQLSVKFPKFLGFYASKKKLLATEAVQAEDDEENGAVADPQKPTDPIPGLSLRSVRFNVAWNIWREMAECGVFLIPTFLSGGEQLVAVPVSAVVGAVVGLIIGLFIYYANQSFKNKKLLCIFAVLLLVFLSAGLSTGGAHSLEEVIGETEVVYDIEGRFWDSDEFPMAILRIFGYSNERTVLEICVYWCWLFLAAVLHAYKFYSSRITPTATEADASATPMEKETTIEKETASGNAESEEGDASATSLDKETTIDKETASGNAGSEEGNVEKKVEHSEAE